MTTLEIDRNTASMQEALAQVIATFATAAGVIHLEASVDHRDLTVIAFGFAAMAIGQTALAGLLLMRPTRTVFIAVGALHAVIALIWILSRTIGLPFVPGVEGAAQVGVADAVANIFSIAVVGAALVALYLDRSGQTVSLPPTTARAVKAMAILGALILTAAAVSQTHEHLPDGAPASLPASGHGHEHQASPESSHETNPSPRFELAHRG